MVNRGGKMSGWRRSPTRGVRGVSIVPSPTEAEVVAEHAGEVPYRAGGYPSGSIGQAGGSHGSRGYIVVDCSTESNEREPGAA